MLGYPILSVRSIPQDASTSTATTRRSSRRGSSRAPLELNHVWPENYSVNSAQKVWAAEFAAHHPNVVVLDLSSLQVRPRRADLRAHRLDHRDEQDAVRGAARHRREQAGRLDQDPREDLRPRAEAPRGAPRRTRRKRKGELDARDRPEAPRAPDAAHRAARRAQPAGPRHRGAARRGRASASRAYEAPGARPEPRAAEGPHPARQEDRRRQPSMPSAESATNRQQRPQSERPADEQRRNRQGQEVAPGSIDMDAELQDVRGGGAQAPRPRREDRAVDRGHGQPHLHQEGEGARSRCSSAASRWRTTTSSRPRSAASATTCRCSSARTTRRSSSARSSATAASATRRTSPSATW